MSGVRRAVEFTLPSVVAAMLAAALVGLVDGWLNTDGGLELVATAGFFGLVAMPVGFVGSLVARGLWRAWQLEELAADATEPTGGAPRLVAWGGYAILSVWFLTGASFNIIRLLMISTSSKGVIALAAALSIAIVASFLIGVARPAVRALAALVRAVDRRVGPRLGASLFTPRRAAFAGVAVLIALLYGAWTISVEPRIGHLDLGFMRYLIGGAVLVVATHVGWSYLRDRRVAAIATAAVSIALGVATLSAAMYARYSRPYAMLDIWGNTRVAGDVIDLVWDISSLREELRLGEFGPEPRPGAAHPNIVLITIDTVRADRTPLHGGTASMPTLVALGRDGTVFDWAFAPGNVTRRSLPTFALGLSPRRVRGRVAGWALRLDPRHVTLAERLRAAGYETAGFFCCESQFAPRHRLGLIRGFDELVLEYKGDKLAEAAADYVQQRDGDVPLFMWIHFIEPHLWEKTYSTSKHGKKIKQRYDKSLVKTDTFLRTLMEVLRTGERKNDTIVLITADHGEALGDHGHRNHSTTLYNDQVQVPFVVVGPGVAKQRVEMPVGLVDLVPTIIDLAGFVPPGMPAMDGKSLAPVLRAAVQPRMEDAAVRVDMVADRSVRNDIYALIRGRYKLIYRDDGKLRQLFDIVADPKEKKNLASEQPGRVEQMVRELDELRAIDDIDPF